MTLAGITSDEIFSAATIDRLVVAPLRVSSVALANLVNLDVTSTHTFLPVVNSSDVAGFYPDLTQINESTADAHEIEVVPKSVKVLRTISNQSIRDTAASQIIGAALVGEMARGIDKAVFSGSGPTGPLGLPGLIGVGNLVADPTDLDVWLDAIAMIELAGGIPTVAFVNPTDWVTLAKLKVTADSQQPILQPVGNLSAAASRTVHGVAVAATPYIPVGSMWVCDGTRTAVVLRQPFEISVGDGDAFGRDGQQLRGVCRVEVASFYPSTCVHVHAA